MNKIDFSQEYVRVTLPNQAQYLNPKTKEYSIIDSVDIKRLNTPQIALLKTRVAQSIAPGASGAASMVPFIQILCKIAISRLYEGGKVVTVDIDRVVDVIPFESSYKLALFIIMHMKEASFMTTAYQCVQSQCRKTNYFDVDPSQPIPDDLERGKRLMEDFLDFCTETVNENANRLFTHTLTKPVKIDVPKDPKKLEGIEWEQAEISTFRFSYPTLGTLANIALNPDRSGAMDYYSLYEHLEEIGDFDKAITQKIKMRNTIDKVFNIRPEEFKKLTKHIDAYTLKVEHFFECDFCGHLNEVPFDMTNFFEFLRS